MMNKEKQYHLSADKQDYFTGKTIKSIDSSAINSWTFYFTDGTSVELFADTWGPLQLPGMWPSLKK